MERTDNGEARTTTKTYRPKTSAEPPGIRREAGGLSKALLGDEGISLVETLVTLMIAGILASSLLVLAESGKKAIVGAQRVSEASTISGSVMSRILSEEERRESGAVKRGDREYRWNVKLSDLPGGRLRTLDLTVEWDEFGAPRSMTLSTLTALDRAAASGKASGSGSAGEESSGASGEKGDEAAGSPATSDGTKAEGS